MKNFTTIFLAIAFFTSCCCCILEVNSMEFQVGGDKGWSIPPSNDTDHYNQWASHNRFNINDTLRFEYKKQDSVLVVTKEEHEKCISSDPIYFSNNGDTSFQLDRSGFYYFISGVTGHCERGLKMIVKVLEHENAADQTANQTSTKSSEAMSVLKMDGDTLSQTLMIVGIIAMFTVFYM